MWQALMDSQQLSPSLERQFSERTCYYLGYAKIISRERVERTAYRHFFDKSHYIVVITLGNNSVKKPNICTSNNNIFERRQSLYIRNTGLKWSTYKYVIWTKLRTQKGQCHHQAKVCKQNRKYLSNTHFFLGMINFLINTR